MNTNLELIYQALEDIAKATRQKLGETDKYTLMEIPEKIRSISGGGGTNSSLWSLKSYPRNIVKNPIPNVTGLFYYRAAQPTVYCIEIAFDEIGNIGTTDWQRITVTP